MGLCLSLPLNEFDGSLTENETVHRSYEFKPFYQQLYVVMLWLQTPSFSHSSRKYVNDETFISVWDEQTHTIRQIFVYIGANVCRYFERVLKMRRKAA